MLRFAALNDGDQMPRAVWIQRSLTIHGVVRPISAGSAYCILLFLSACSALAGADNEQNTGSLHGPTDFLQQNLIQSAEEARLLANAERHLQSGDEDAAFVALLQIFSRPHDAFTPIFSGKPSHSTYRSALALLQTADFTTRTAWLQATEPLAAQALRKAVADGTVAELRSVSQSFPFTRSGMKALALQASLAYGRGQRNLARVLVREMENLAATRVDFPTSDLLPRFRHQLDEHAPHTDVSSNVVTAVGQADVPTELTLPWPTPLWKWQESIWASPRAAVTLAALLQPEHRNELSMNFWSPVITPDAVIMRTPFRIISFKRDSGDIDWFLPTDTVPQNDRMKAAYEFPYSRRGSLARLLSHEVLGSLATDDGFLFFIDHFHHFGGQLVNSVAGGLNPGGIISTDALPGGTRLVAVQLTPHPHVSWTLGGPDFGYKIRRGADDKFLSQGTSFSADDDDDDVKSEFHGQRFLGTPLVYDGMLFALSTDDEIVWLSCLTQATGRMIWQRPLTYENANVPTRRSRFPTSVEKNDGVSLCGVQGDTLICAVKSGVVIGTRIVDGQFKWATSIRDANNSAHSARNMMLSGMSSTSPSGFRPMFHDRKMIWASDHSAMVHCIDTDSGRILWQKDRDVSGSGLVEGSRDRYALAVLQDRTVLVGNRHVRALRMSDGTQLWNTPIQEQTGRGTCNAEVCLIPLQDATIAQIDIQTGRANSMARPLFENNSHVTLGSLVADDEILCAATPLSVSVLPTIQAVRQRMDKGTSANSRERLVAAQSQLFSAKPVAGVTSLRSLLSDETVGSEASEVLAETLLLLLAKNRFQHSAESDSVSDAKEILDRLALTKEQQIRRFLLGSARQPAENENRTKSPLLPLLPDWQVRADVAAWTELSANRASAVAPFSFENDVRLTFATIEHAIRFPHRTGTVTGQISFARRLKHSHYPTAAHLFLLSAARTATETDRLTLKNELPKARAALTSSDHSVGSEQHSHAGGAERDPLEVRIEESPMLSSGSRLVSVLSIEKGVVETPPWFSDRLFRTSQGVVSVNMGVGTISAPAALPETAEPVTPLSDFQSSGIIPLKDDRHVGVMSLVANGGPSLLWWKRLDHGVTSHSPLKIGPVGPGFLIVAGGNQLFCLHPFTGSLLWKRTVISDVTRRTGFGEAARLVGDDRIIGVLGKKRESCQLFRTKDGKRLDVVRLDIPDGQTPLVYGRMVLFHRDQRLVLVDVLSGHDLMHTAPRVGVSPSPMAELLPRGRAVTISDDMDLVVLDLQTGHSDIRCSLTAHMDTSKIWGLKAFEHLNHLFVLLKNGDHSHRDLSNTSRMGETRLETGTLICVDQEAGKILWSRPTVPSVLTKIQGDPTELLVTWSWKNHEYPFLRRQVGERQNNENNVRSRGGRSLVVNVIDGRTGTTLAEREFSNYSAERDEPVRFLHHTDSSTISIETVRSRILITYGS